MLFRTRARTYALLVAGTLGLSGFGVAAAGSAQAVSWDCGTEVHATWGGGQFCDGSDGTWKIRTRDEATDGYCVLGKYYSEDSNSWRNTSPSSQECNGVWKTTIIGTQPHSDGVRLYRGDGRYLTLPQ